MQKEQEIELLSGHYKNIISLLGEDASREAC